MGGTLWLTTIGPDRHTEFDRTEDVQVDDTETSWSYSYSGIGHVKGIVIRAAIEYLESVQKQANRDKQANVEGARQRLLDAGITAVKASPNDEAALADAAIALAAAISFLRGWVRPPKAHGRLDNIDALFAILDRGGKPGVADLDIALDLNYHLSEVSKYYSCPPVLARVGMRGLFEFAKLADNDQTIFHDEAQRMADVLERVMALLPTEDPVGDNWQEFCTDMKSLLRLCGEDQILVG
ncbi:hypothetical protein OH76DRAFT_137000 [Lentinus brumalis]|uniref:Uncharacterized protein n=1 Tax=Lentinus brumalis TaxID=2498619 RepID=A0A371CPN8_9APHY|nr:hypothetical protein OH76DRAFT_137000 [Polyporus brumalis]